MRMAVDVRELNRVAMEVVVHDHLVVFEKVLHQLRPDEPGPAGYDTRFLSQTRTLLSDAGRYSPW